MFLFIYVDCFALYKPGLIDNLRAGIVFEFDISPTLLTMMLASVAIPALMVMLSMTLPVRVNRATNLGPQRVECAGGHLISLVSMERPAPVPQVIDLRGSSPLERTEPQPEGAGRHEQCDAVWSDPSGSGRAQGFHLGGGTAFGAGVGRGGQDLSRRAVGAPADRPVSRSGAAARLLRGRPDRLRAAAAAGPAAPGRGAGGHPDPHRDGGGGAGSVPGPGRCGRRPPAGPAAAGEGWAPPPPGLPGRGGLGGRPRGG